jgi:hypothetical protein
MAVLFRSTDQYRTDQFRKILGFFVIDCGKYSLRRYLEIRYPEADGIINGVGNSDYMDVEKPANDPFVLNRGKDHGYLT